MHQRALPRWMVVVFLAPLAAFACSDDADDGSGAGAAGAGSATTGSGTPGAGLPCDVKTILQENCWTCHTDPPKYGAAMPLMDRDDLLAAPAGTAKGTFATVGEAILSRIDSAESPMPPPPNLPLSDAQKATLRAYIQAGAPESSDTCAGDGGGGQGGGYDLPCTPDVILKPAAPYEMPQQSLDEYVCFGVEAPSDIARHITAIAPDIDNETILHHILLLQAPSAVSAQGEPCDFVNLDWKLIYAWGPGTPPLVLPQEAGFPIGPDEPGHFVLQMHYNNVMGLAGETDQTGMGLCTTDQLRENDADVMAFGGTDFELGVNQSTTLACDMTVPAEADFLFPVTVFQAWPHMHQLGRAMDTYITKAGGEVVPLANVPNYDFEYQVTYPVNTKLDVGDRVTTKCTWDNTTGSPVGFGEGTQDEMCFNFVSYYPRINFQQWHWLLPSYGATCSYE
jgi:hypothetical protein